jgi:hypothetical protein
MSFWGLSQSGKDARGQLAEMPRWYKDRFTQNLGRGDDAYNTAQSLRDQYRFYIQDAIDKGYLSPEDINSVGQRALPGVDDAISRMNGRWGTMRDSYFSGVPQSWDTAGTIDNNLDLAGRSNQSNFDTTRDLIDSGYGSAYGRGDTAYNDVMGSLRGQGDKQSGVYGDLRSGSGREYGGLLAGSDRTYGDLIGDSDGTYADLAKGNAGAYGKAEANVERLLPGGDLAAARVARAYAPQMVSTLGRLRAGGTDPNSLQAQGVIAQVERDRARGMDEALSQNLDKYVGAKNELTLGQEGVRRGLGLSGLQNRQGLAERQMGNRQDLTLGRLANDQGLSLANLRDYAALSGEYRDYTSRNAANKQALDLGYMNDQVGANDTAYTRGVQNLYDRNNAAMQRRGMAQQDWNTQAGILQGENAQELTNLGLKRQQYDMGNQWAGNDLQQRNWGVANMGGLMNDQYRTGQGYDQQAMGWGDRAQQGFQNTYNTEQANAGWGKRMLLGAGLAAASLIPGVGPAIATIGGGAMRGMGGGGQQGNGYGGYAGGGYPGGYPGTPPFFPQFNTRGGGNYTRQDRMNGWDYGG